MSSERVTVGGVEHVVDVEYIIAGKAEMMVNGVFVARVDYGEDIGVRENILRALSAAKQTEPSTQPENAKKEPEMQQEAAKFEVGDLVEFADGGTGGTIEWIGMDGAVEAATVKWENGRTGLYPIGSLRLKPATLNAQAAVLAQNAELQRQVEVSRKALGRMASEDHDLLSRGDHADYARTALAEIEGRGSGEESSDGK